MDEIEPEYATMSRRPGIGYNWFQKYKTDVYPHDYVVINGFKVKPPRYYDNLLPEEERDQIKKKRMENYEDPDYEQLFKAEKIKISALQQLLRDL